MKRAMGWIGLAMMVGACGSAEPTTFVISNGGERDLYLQQNHELTMRADGEQVSMTEPTCMSECGLFQGQIVCALGAEYPTVRRMGPGAEQVMPWDGVYYVVADGANCWKKREGNADFEIQVCYGDDFERIEDGNPEAVGDTVPGANVKDPVCESQPFERGGDVEIVIE